MATSIKITALTDIAGNLAYSTIIPVVNMSGIPVSEKANLHIVGNLFLAGAGGNFVEAAVANTVSSAAQPNVTSLGTLTTVAVVGTANAVGGGSVVGASSTVNIDPAFGSSDWNDPASAQAVRGRVTGADLTKTNNYVVGVTGMYNVTGTNASVFPKVGVLGVVSDTTTTADAAFMAFVDGDGGETRAGAAFKVGMINTTANSGFDYGLDLQFLDTGIPSSTQPFKAADVRLNNGLLIKSVTTAVTDGDATTLAIGTVVLTSHATGVGLMFISNGSILKQLAFTTP